MLDRHSQSSDGQIAANRGWFERRSTAFKIGVILGSAHLFFVLFSVIDIIHRHEGRWTMFWTLVGYIDFPVTFLLSKVILPVFAPYFVCGDPYLAAGRSLQLFIIFTLFHALVGSGWYFALPMLISRASARIASTKQAAVAAGAMMLIPIPANWLQLIRFFGYDTAPAAIGLNSVLPGLWTACFAWLLIINAKRKILLWLVLLLPFVFYYLVGDLYYYFVLAHN